MKAKETRLKSSVPHVVSDSVGFGAIYPSFSDAVFDTRRQQYSAILEYRHQSVLFVIKFLQFNQVRFVILMEKFQE